MVQVTTSAMWQLVIYNPENVQRNQPNHLTWGSPDASGRAAGLKFTGTTTEAPLDGQEFTVGTLTVDNFVREGAATLERIPLRLDIEAQLDGGPAQPFQPYLEYFAINDEQQDSDDTLLVRRYPTTEKSTIDGVPYALVLCGFPTDRDEPPADTLHIPEGKSVTAELRAMFVRADKLDIVIRTVNYAGTTVTQADEYIEILNRSATMVPMGGWVLNAGDVGQDYTFPDVTLTPGIPIRVYTNQVHPAWGGHSFGSATGIWSNVGDTAELRNKQGTVVARYAYGTDAAVPLG